MSSIGYTNIFLIFIILQGLYYISRQRILLGIYSIGAFCTLFNIAMIIFFFLMNTPMLNDSDYLVYCLFTINAATFMLSLSGCFRKYLLSLMQRIWFFSPLALIVAGVIALFVQAYIYQLSINSSLNAFNLLVTKYMLLQGFFLAILIALVTYFCIPLYTYHASIRKHQLIGFQLEPVISALNQELEEYLNQLTHLKKMPLDNTQQFLTHTIENKIKDSKMPLYADRTDVSMALYPFITADMSNNTWIETSHTKLSTSELSFLLTLICNYLQTYDPKLILSIQMTALTNGNLFIEIQNNILKPTHVQALIKNQKLLLSNGHFPNAHINRICLRYILIKYAIQMKHMIFDDSRQAIVLTH